MIVRIIPLEPLHIGVKQVSGYEDIGADRVLHLPPPSTVLGALASLLGRTDVDDPFEGLGCERVWGPLVEIRGRRYFQSEGYLYAEEEVERYIKAVKSPAGERPRRCCRLREVVRPAVRLEEGKAARNLYFVKLTYVEGKEVSVGDVAYVYYVECKDVSARREIARVGGEGRAAVVEIVNDDFKPRVCREGVLLSPLLFYSEGPYAEVGRSEGLKELEEVYGVLAERWPPKVRSIYVGLGYSMSRNVRRALYQALPPGTVVRLRNEASAAGLFAERGYGSLLCP